MAHRNSKTRYEDVKFDTYIYRVLKQVHPDTGMSGDGLSELNNLIRILVQRVVNAVNLLMQNSKGRKTISSREIQSAVRLVLPGELAKHAVSEGTKAVTTYNASTGGQKGHPVSRGQRAGLRFPVTRVETVMMELATVRRKGAGAAVYFAAVLEYLCAEILEIGGNVARDNKKVRITPRHLKLAILNDEELRALFKGVVMSGGVIPHIHSSLLPKKKEDGETEHKKAPRKKPTKGSAKPAAKPRTGSAKKSPSKKKSSPAKQTKGNTRPKGRAKGKSKA